MRLTTPLLDAAIEAVTTSPLWRSIRAVAAGNVAMLNGQNAFANYGLGEVEAALDQLTTQLD